MCYTIPGRVISIDNNVVTVDYFGEKRKARNEFYQLLPGDYIYAQGGFVIQKIPQKEALLSLDAWGELFFKLKEIDLRLTSKTENLYQSANAIRQKYLGNAACVHGIIEFSNYCRQNCLYCGIRSANDKLRRYRMDIDELAGAVDYAVNELGFKSLVLQSGEDEWYTKEKIARLIKKIREKNAVLLILSIGERDKEEYQDFYEAGARGILLRFETSNPALYEKYKPGNLLAERVELIKALRQMGYLVMTGFLLGLPGQTQEDLFKDIDLTASFKPDMFSFGPFIPHPDTPLAKSEPPSIDSVIESIARARIMHNDAKILATTALETLDPENGARRALLAGANSLMINVTPPEYRRLYEIYPKRAAVDLKISERIKSVVSLLQSLGRVPTDLGL